MNYFNSYSEDKRALLSTLWIFILVNALFRDLNSIELLMAGGIMLELQIAMIALSRILPEQINRWANLLIAVLSIILVIFTKHKGLDDVFFVAAQIVGLITIIWVTLSMTRLQDLIRFIDMPTRP